MTRHDLHKMYASDPEILSTYHIRAGEGLEVCVDDTWDIISNCDKHLFDWGYFAIDRSDLIPKLSGFFIYPDYRNAEYKQLFYESLCKEMPKTFLSGLHAKNTRGIKFLLKFGNIVTQNEKHVHFVFRTGR